MNQKEKNQFAEFAEKLGIIEGKIDGINNRLDLHILPQLESHEKSIVCLKRFKNKVTGALSLLSFIVTLLISIVWWVLWQ